MRSFRSRWSRQVAKGSPDGTLTAVYDGLTAFRRSGGAAGLTLVPDLATTLPRPTAGGTTYTFTLRRGIRYSNGAPMRASDFRRGMQRQLSFGLGAGYYEGLLGGSACIKHPDRCDLSAGIVTDDAAGRVTFRLVQADPDFLYKLGLPLAVPAPPGAPSHVIDRAPFLPGTGPYMISQVRPNKSFTLVRNPYFRQWSYAAQPAGYPSVIRYEQVKSQSAQESAVVTGQADLADLEEGDLQSLAIQYPARVYVGAAGPGGRERWAATSGRAVTSWSTSCACMGSTSCSGFRARATSPRWTRSTTCRRCATSSAARKAGRR